MRQTKAKAQGGPLSFTSDHRAPQAQTEEVDQHPQRQTTTQETLPEAARDQATPFHHRPHQPVETGSKRVDHMLKDPAAQSTSKVSPETPLGLDLGHVQPVRAQELSPAFRAAAEAPPLPRGHAPPLQGGQQEAAPHLPSRPARGGPQDLDGHLAAGLARDGGAAAPPPAAVLRPGVRRGWVGCPLNGLQREVEEDRERDRGLGGLLHTHDVRGAGGRHAQADPCHRRAG